MANMTAAFIVGGLAPRAERLDGAVEAALQAFGSRAAAEPILSGLSSGFSAHSHEIESALLSIPPRARSAPFVHFAPKVPDLLENQDRWLAFSDDFRALTLLGRQYHRSPLLLNASFIVP